MIVARKKNEEADEEISNLKEEEVAIIKEIENTERQVIRS